MRVLLLGDSIRLAYAPSVRERLADVAEVVDFPDNGGDSANVRAKLGQWLADARALDIVHVNCGLHDIKRAYNSDARQISLENYETNVRAILSRLTGESNAKTVWATSTPVLDERHHATKGFDRFNSDVVEYNAVAVRLAGDAGVPVNDLYRAIADGDPPTSIGADGVHMTTRGNEILADAVARFVRKLM